MRSLLATVVLLVLSCSIVAGQSTDTLTYVGDPSWSISQAVQIPADRSMFWTSGTIPPTVDTTAAEDDPARYGDMETQATGVLKHIEGLLADRGMTLNDIVYLRVYLAPDETGTVNFDGWSTAYGKFFGTEETPTKPARSTVAVHQLVNPGWRIEIEAFAVLPEDL